MCITMYMWKHFQSNGEFYYNIPKHLYLGTNKFRYIRCQSMAIQNNMANITLALAFTLNVYGELKDSHDLVVGICWSVNEFVIIVINHA